MGERGYYLYKNGEKVYLEEGITVLGEVLKNPDDDNIVEIFIPSSVRMIMDYAFAGCASLQSVKIESGSMLNYINECAFWNCSSLKKIEFENAVHLKWIGEKAFVGTALESIDLSCCRAYLGRSAFEDCSALEVVKYSNIGVVPTRCFMHCKNLLKIKALHLYVLEEMAFGDCGSLTKVEITCYEGVHDGGFNDHFTRCL